MKAAERNALPSSKFALPAERKFPVNDRSHAGNAKARASQAEKAGRISKSTEEKIDAAANRVLYHGHKPNGEKHTSDGKGHFSRH